MDEKWFIITAVSTFIIDNKAQFPFLSKILTFVFGSLSSYILIQNSDIIKMEKE